LVQGEELTVDDGLQIKAKEAAQNARQPSRSISLDGGTAAAAAERMVEFKRKSMLSRLPDVADGVYMCVIKTIVCVWLETDEG
jgi:hypothetical protein